jgi:hypothetical protein
MIQRPNALALMLCDQVMIELATYKPSLIGIFTGIAVGGFPSGPHRFDVFAALTDGLGSGTIELSVTEMASGEQAYAQSSSLNCTDSLLVINMRMRVRQCFFPVAGDYLFTLSADGEEIAHRRIRVYQGEQE